MTEATVTLSIVHVHHPTALSLQSYPSPGHLNIRLFGNNSAAAACLQCF